MNAFAPDRYGRQRALQWSDLPTADVRDDEAWVEVRASALRHSLELLAHESDVDGFLGRMLADIGGRLDARYVLLWLTDARSGAAVARLAWSRAGGPGHADDLLPPEWMGAVLQQRDTPLDALESSGVLHLPLVMGDHSPGGIAVLLPSTEQLPRAEKAWAQSLAYQTNLALQLGWRSDERVAAALRKERARIAREIHDGIAQAFVGIHRRLQSASASGDWVAVAGAIELAKEGLAEARRTMQALGPRQLGDMAFLDAVQDIAGKVIPQNIQFLLSTKGAWPVLAPEREANLFRVVQEAFNNVARHSFATRLNLDVSSTPSELSLLVEDNGCGFDVRGTEAGFGLTYMRQRIDAIDGVLKVSSVPGSGTQIHIRLPHG